MNFDATFWVAISFFIFLGVLFYFKVPQKVFGALNESINKIKKDIDEAEKLKEEAKNILSEYEAKLSKSKVEVDLMIKNAQKESETNIIKINDQFHSIFENRKKMAEDKIKQMKLQATKDIKNYSVEVAIIALEKIIKNSVDKKKLDKIYISSVDEAKKILKNKSI
jgi:F-type H+-transporting ATPase subunit b|tara:strand:+ start:685 stop:1182 length:498 start_codon:yes stop_codon:yes gene_type:complete